jgi:hypothetical protein
LHATAAAWPDAVRRIRLIAEPQTVSQWAQDNGKAGSVAVEGQDPEPATLVPRYASRREDGSVFVPPESFLMEGLAASGHRVVASPLLFQGGDLLVVREPRSGERWLFLGEAEVHRNTALGLSRDQVLEAFRTELDVDRSIVLPSISFHIDFDVSFRARDRTLIAFVNDPLMAAVLVVREGVFALSRSGLLSSESMREVVGQVGRGRSREHVTAIEAALFRHRDAQGRFPLRVARGFASPSGSDVGDFQLFLVALDILAASVLTAEELTGGDHRSAYFRSYRRRDALRRELREQLRALGIRVVSVPGWSEGKRSLSYTNGIHLPGRYLMPAYGGTYAALDEVARTVIRNALGPDIDVVPVICSETQRRAGGLHCAVSVYSR